MWWFSDKKMRKNYAQVFYERAPRDTFVLDPVKMAVSPDGTYVFIIGSRKKKQIVATSTSSPREWMTSFKLDVFDLILEKRRTLLLNNLTDFGDYLVHIYALNKETLIIVDYNHRQTTLRQRIVKIGNNIAISPIHRCYRYGTSQTSFIRVAVGDRLCAVVSKQQFEGQFAALIVPKDPLETDPKTTNDVSIHVNNVREMNTQLHATLSLNISHYIAPFFSRDDRDLCFIAVDCATMTVHPTIISCLDLCSYKWYTRETVSDEISGFPRDEYQQTPIVVDCFVIQNNKEQAGLVARYRIPLSNWRWQICSVLQWIQIRLVRLFFLTVNAQIETLGSVILHLTTFLSYLRNRLVLRPYARVGFLNLRSWRWFEHPSILQNVHYVDQLTNLASQTGQIISFISETWEDSDCEQKIRMGLSPTSMLSLMALSDYEIRRNGNSELRILRHQFMEHIKLE